MLVNCKGCQGSGTMTLVTRFMPTTNHQTIQCPGCGGDGKVNVPDPNALCARCTGAGIITVQPLPGGFDMSGGHTESCPGCGGSGYAS